MRLDDLLATSNKMFSRQASFKTLCQTLAEHFYPERADFTITRNIGNELADGLLDSYPILCRRDLGNGISSMLRDGPEWFEIDVAGDDPDYAGKEWLQSRSKALQRMFGHTSSGFTRATKQGDHDYVAFGQAVLSVEPNKNYNGILVRNWHLRDCAWEDDETGQVGPVHRKWAPSLYELKRTFGEHALHQSQVDKCRTEPMATAKIRHIVMPSEMYGKGQFEQFGWVSLFVDMEREHIIQERGINYKYYSVPRFQTIAGAPYAYSPATVAALPNARALQAMTFTLMEAAERYARPPLTATAQVVRSDIDLGPDGITWIDRDYDQKTGRALEPLLQDRGGYPIGMDFREKVVDVLSSCFYLNRLSLPETTHEMTAYEVSERMKQYRRENLPLFAPIEKDYNGQLCEAAFGLAFDMNLLGSPHDVPSSLRDRDIEWKFRSPLSSADEEKKVQQFQLNADMLATAAQMDPMIAHDYDVRTAFRDAVEATGSPIKWLRDMEEVVELDQVKAGMMKAQAQLEMQGAEAA